MKMVDFTTLPRAVTQLALLGGIHKIHNTFTFFHYSIVFGPSSHRTKCKPSSIFSKLFISNLTDAVLQTIQTLACCVRAG